jgi:hypothetical protein
MRSGVPAGPALGRLLARSREVQDETGWEEAERIMARVRRLEPAAARGEDRGRRSPDLTD